MKTLIVEDDFTSRLLLQEVLKRYGSVHIAVNGQEAVAAVSAALEAGEHYDLICLDIMMPQMDGYEALEKIRQLEEEHGFNSTTGSKVVMTTALDQMTNISQAFWSLCDAYVTKPINHAKLKAHLSEFQLI